MAHATARRGYAAGVERERGDAYPSIRRRAQAAQRRPCATAPRRTTPGARARIDDARARVHARAEAAGGAAAQNDWRGRAPAAISPPPDRPGPPAQDTGLVRVVATQRRRASSQWVSIPTAAPAARGSGNDHAHERVTIRCGPVGASRQLAHGASAAELSEDLIDTLGREVLVEVIIDEHHGSRAAGGETLRGA